MYRVIKVVFLIVFISIINVEIRVKIKKLYLFLLKTKYVISPIKLTLCQIVVLFFIFILREGTILSR